jgi:hypothetical protein
MRSKIVKSVVTFIKVVIAIVSLLAPIIFVNDVYRPWHVANDLRTAYSADYFFVPVGGSWRNGERKSQTALLVPRNVTAPMSVSISGNHEDPIVEEDRFSFWIIITVLIYGWFMLFRYVQRRLLDGGAT